MNKNDNATGSTLPADSRDTKTSVWWKRPWVSIVTLLVLALAGYVWWAKPAFLFKGQAVEQAAGSAPGGPGGFAGPGGGGRRNMPMAPVGAARARTADVNIYIPALGSVVASNTATVRARIDGLVLTKLNFKEGQTVKQGQVLAELDPRSAQVQLAQAQGQLVRDQALLQNGKLDLERYRALLAQDSIAKQQLDTQEALVRQQEATVKIDQANVDAAKLQLSYTSVTAPISGRVGLKQVDIGNIVRSSDTNGIAIITQVTPIDVVFTIPEVNLARVLRQLQEGAVLPVEAWDREQKNQLASGQLLTVDNQIDASTGTIKLKARFSNDDLALFPNQFVNTKLLMDVRHGATVVPTAALLRGTDGQFVYVVKDDKSVTVRQIRAGAVQGDDTMILSGVEPGEVVVIDGTDRLREGMKVDVIVRAEQEVKVGTKQPRRSRNGGGFPGMPPGGMPPGGMPPGGMPGGAPGNGQGFGGGNRPGNAEGGAPNGMNGGQRPGGQMSEAAKAAPGGAGPAAGGGQNDGRNFGNFGGGNRPTNPDGTPMQRPTNPDGTPRQFPGGGNFGGGNRPTNPDGTPMQRPMNPDGTPRSWPTNPDGSPRRFDGQGGGHPTAPAQSPAQ